MRPTRDQIVTGQLGLVVNGPHLGEWVDWLPPYHEVLVMNVLPKKPYSEMPNVAAEAHIVRYRTLYIDVGSEKVRLWAQIVFDPDLIDVLIALADGAEFKKCFERDLNFRFNVMKWPLKETS